MLKDQITGFCFNCPNCNHLTGATEFETVESNHIKAPRQNEIDWKESNFFVGNCDGCGIEFIFKRKKATSLEDYEITFLKDGQHIPCELIYFKG